MQAIVSKHIPATNTKGARIKAVCERGSITISYPHELSGEEAHCYAVAQLVARFAAEDLKQYSTPTKANPWLRPLICGQLPSGDYVHVFSPISPGIEIAITLDGGIISDVFCDQALRVTVIDFDVEGMDEDLLTTISQPEASDTSARVHKLESEPIPANLRKVVES